MWHLFNQQRDFKKLFICRSEEEKANQGDVHAVPGSGAGGGFPADSLSRRQHQRRVGRPPAADGGTNTGTTPAGGAAAEGP